MTDEPTFRDPQIQTCPKGHEYPLMAGTCPYCDPATAAELERREVGPRVFTRSYVPDGGDLVDQQGRSYLGTEHPLRAVPMVAEVFVASDYLLWRDNGLPPRTAHDYGYERKVGLVNHIPVCDTLDQLTAYFTGGSAQGSTHFGVDRAEAGWLTAGGWTFPVARVDQYLPIRRSADYPQGCSPWAQGVISRSANCAVPPADAISRMRSGEPNGAFHSVENVARTGAQGVTDAQFNSNAVLRAYLAALDGYPITPSTQIWHAEVDQLNRCADPGWSGDLEDEMQAAANALLRNDPSGLRQARRVDAPAPGPVPAPEVGRETRLLPEGTPEVTYEYTDDPSVRLQTTRQHVRIVRDA